MVDFHTHTLDSDGKKSQKQVIEQAIASKLRYLAITDHNYFNPNFTELKNEYSDKITLIPGVEISCIYEQENKNKIELHIVALDFNEEKMLRLLEEYQFDRALYTGKIIEKIRQNCNIPIPTYDEMLKLYAGSRRIGRLHIADWLTQNGYVEDINEGFLKYVGSRGCAYVNKLNFTSYDTMEIAVKRILETGGIPVLAHLFSYGFDESECQRVARKFKKAVADRIAAIEVFYGRYNQKQQKKLQQMADDLQLYYSSGSDYHAKTQEDTLMLSEHLLNENINKHILNFITGGYAFE